MDSTTDKKTFLLQEPEAGKTCRLRKTHNPWAVLFVLFIILSAVFGAAFVGGYFLGKDKGKTESQDSTQSNQHRAYTLQYDGNSQVIPAFRGSIPVQDFIQPRTVLVNGRLESAPGNPLLTPKGTSQIFIYQYGDEVSFIVTATGQNYGEMVDNASLVGEGQYTLTTTGLEGDLVQLTDGYHQQYDRVPIPNSFSMDLQWGNVGSHGFIVVLADPSSLEATLHFSGLSGAQQPLNIRGCHEYDTEIAELPSPDFPLRLTPYTGQFALQNKPDSSETPIPGASQSSNLQLVRLNSGSRRRRSMATRSSPGMGFILSHPDTKEVLHRIELRWEERHGGKNGSLCWSVQNHVDRVEASFCALFHQALYNGLDNVPSDDGTSSMLINTHFRYMNDGSYSTDPWNHVVSLVHDFNPDDVIQSIKNRNTRSFGSFFRSVAHVAKAVVSDVGHGAHEAWDKVKDGAKTAYSAVTNEARSIGQGIKEHWHCDLGDSLLKGGKCVFGGVDCGTDLAGEVDTVGLDTAETIVGCASATKDCAEFGRDCF